MDFNASPVQQELRDLTRKFVKNNIWPIVEKDEESGTFRPEVIAGLGELGLTGIPVDENYGGAGLGYQDYIVAIEEIARASASYAISVAVTGLPQVILQEGGTEAQKQKYIPSLAAGKAIGSFSLSEASSGSDAASLRTTARREGDHYVLNGTKLWTTQADSASTILLMARTGGPGPKGISTFVLEKGVPGLRMGKRKKRWDSTSPIPWKSCSAM